MSVKLMGNDPLSNEVVDVNAQDGRILVYNTMDEPLNFGEHSIATYPLKDDATVAHNGISGTTTSNEIDVTGFNSVLVHVVITGTCAWTVKLQGSPTSGGTFVDLYDNLNTLQSTGSISASRCKLMYAHPDYVKVVATLDSGTGTCTVNVIPTNY